MSTATAAARSARGRPDRRVTGDARTVWTPRVTLQLTPIIEGNDSGPTVVFIQGWPDDASLWDDVAVALRSDYRCVRVTLPNFAGDRTERWGYGTDEIVRALEVFVREAGRGKPVILVLHDWGCNRH